jgi:hypothetical protein
LVFLWGESIKRFVMHLLQNPQFRSSIVRAGYLYNVYVPILGENLRLHVADLKTEESTEFRQDISSLSQFIKKKTCVYWNLKLKLSPFGDSLQSCYFKAVCVYICLIFIEIRKSGEEAKTNEKWEKNH